MRRTYANAQTIPRWLRRLKIGAVILVILLGGDLILDAIKWPFRRGPTISSLERVSACSVEIGRFHGTFFPHPGYVAETVIFTRSPGSASVTLAKIKKLTCRASWFAVLSFTHRISRIDLEGLQVLIPDRIPPPVHKHSAAAIPTVVSDLFASGAVLEIARGSNKSQPERLDFPTLHLSNLARDKALNFELRIIAARLFGTADVTGSLGPLKLADLKGMNIAGNFRLSSFDLRGFKEIAGTASAYGRFKGRLGRTDVEGRVTIPNFEITRSHHQQTVTAEYRAVTDGTKGDVAIDAATVHFLSSTLLVRGSIRGDRGKTALLEVGSHGARVQDLLRLFINGDLAPVNGALNMQAHVLIPPEPESFLKRVQIDGNFKIENGIFTHGATEDKVDQLSARARGRKDHASPVQVMSQIGSRVKLRKEIATLSDAFFAVPGATVRGSGTYNLQDEAIDLRGRLAMRASLSEAATGIKSILAVPLDPFFKKKGAGSVVRVRITGTYAHPRFKMSL